MAHLHRRSTHTGAKLPEEISSVLSELFYLTFNMLERKVASESQRQATSNVLVWFVSYKSFGTMCQKRKKKLFPFLKNHMEKFSLSSPCLIILVF